jgi:alkylhydroperoxidase/carboxymuconolactone decarboxylase family protein YurZ
MARDGIEPPTPAFSGLGSTILCFLTRLKGYTFENSVKPLSDILSRHSALQNLSQQLVVIGVIVTYGSNHSEPQRFLV